jgi:putative hydrolase
VDEYLGSIQLDSGQMMEQLKRAAAEARTGGDWRGMGGVFLLLSPEQREMFKRMQALMSLLEGHASYVMNEVARDHVNDVDRMRRALSARRKASSLERTMQKAIGFEQKIRQYDTGEHFVRSIVDRAGMSTFNLVWRSPGDLPTLDEIGAPDRWLARVGG